MNAVPSPSVAPVPTRLSRATFYWLFVISGFSGLIYQSIWSHYLKLFLGHAAYAQSLVLAIFMGGLAVGSWVAARLGSGLRNPIVMYALVEGVIGVLALLFHEAFTTLIATFYDSVLPGLAGSPLGPLLKWTAAGGLILPQSILLGMTFPLMTSGVIRRYPDGSGRSLAMLYFTNSLGAAAGVLVSGFFLIDWLGLPGTIRCAGLLNVALALAVLLLVRRDPGSGSPLVPSPGRSVDQIQVGRLFLLAAGVTGAASFIYEVGWIRMLSLVLGSSTHAFELMLSAFITGLALGSLWVNRRIDGIREPVRFAAFVQVAMGVLALASIPVYGASFDVMGRLLDVTPKTDNGYLLFAGVSQAIAFAVMLPATVMAGMTLPIFTHVLLRSGGGERVIGQVYAANTLGAIAGVLFALNVGLPTLGLRNLIGFGALLDIGLGLALLAFAAERSRNAVIPSAVVGALAATVALVVVPLDPLRLVSGVYRFGSINLGGAGQLLYYEDGKTATISLVGQLDGTRTIATNGKPDASIQLSPRLPPSFDERTMVMAAALPLAYKPDARVIANIGFGSGLTTHTMLLDRQVKRLDTVEIEPAMVAGARLFGAPVRRAFEDPRSVVHFEDAKTFFSVSPGVYDIIVSEPSNPWVSGVSSLFSGEFYALSRRHLADDGLLVQWVQFYEFNDELVVSILKALAQHYDDFAVYAMGAENSDGLIVARKTGRLGEPSMGRIFGSPVGEALARVGIRNGVELALRLKLNRRQVEELFARHAAVPANSDYYPYVDQNAARARFKSERAEAFLDR